MDTAPRGSASPRIDRLRALTPSARAVLQSLPACASSGHFAKRMMATRAFGRTGPTDGLIRRLAERTRRADRSPFVRSTRPPAPVCPGKPDQAHRHDLGQTNPRYQTRRRHEPDRADQATKAATRACGIMAKRTGEAAHVRLGGNGRLGRTNPEAAARTKPVPSPSRLNAPTLLPVENSPVFFLLFTGRPIFALAAVVPILSFKGPIRRKSRRLEGGRGSAPTLPPGCFGRTNPRVTQATIWPNEPKEAARSAFGQTNPSCRPVRVFAKRTRGATEPLVFPQTNPRCSPVSV
jgi:hypothetical protein